jgi:WD40 repeat protein
VQDRESGGGLRDRDAVTDRITAVSVRRFDEATGKSESFIDLWDTAAPPERRRRLTGEWARLGGLAFTPDGRSLVSGSEDGTGMVWDVSDLPGRP